VEKGFSVQKIGQLTMVNLRILGIKKGSETAFSAIFRTKNLVSERSKREISGTQNLTFG
jgi:hypothetical protein